MLNPEERYHDQSHRLYRAVRGRVARIHSPFSPGFGKAVLEQYRAEASMLRLRPPREVMR